MAYNLNDVDLDKYVVYYHFPTSSLIAVEKEESKKYVFQTENSLEGIFLSKNNINGWFGIDSDKKDSVLVSDLKKIPFKVAEYSLR